MDCQACLSEIEAEEVVGVDGRMLCIPCAIAIRAAIKTLDASALDERLLVKRQNEMK